jgi:hypothetical protein
MKKETWILIALLGYGLFRYLKDKKQVDSNDGENKNLTPYDLAKIIQQLQKEYNNDPSKIIPALAQKVSVTNDMASAFYEWHLQGRLNEADFSRELQR